LVEVEEAGAGLGKASVVEGKPFIVVGIPAFNEEKTIARVIVAAHSHLIYVSTDYVFDGEKGLYRGEDHPNPHKLLRLHKAERRTNRQGKR